MVRSRKHARTRTRSAGPVLELMGVEVVGGVLVSRANNSGASSTYQRHTPCDCFQCSCQSAGHEVRVVTRQLCSWLWGLVE